MRPEDVYDRLLDQRIIFVGSTLDAAAANLIIAKLLHLMRQNSEADVTLYINCPQGDLESALALYDTIEAIRPDVRTVCIGTAGGGAVLLLAAGAPGKRAALPTARAVLRETQGKISGTAADIDLRARSLLRLRQQANEILARHTGQPIERIEEDTERELVLSAEEAKAYGLIDEIVPPATLAQGT